MRALLSRENYVALGGFACSLEYDVTDVITDSRYSATYLICPPTASLLTIGRIFVIAASVYTIII